jgi:hypothetical protein
MTIYWAEKFISEFPKFRFSPTQISLYPLPSRPTEGRIAIVTDAERDAMDAAVPGARDDGRAGLPVSRQQRADERRFFDFAKASVGQADTYGVDGSRGRRSRVVLTPRRWRQVCGGFARPTGRTEP